jgi:Nucleotidyl transferase AbiEii toxin, Type IV TA system
MNIAERVEQYEKRGFARETAAVNVLLEEALQILLSSFPDTFIFFGGASLVLFYGSPRHSGDLDLLVSAENPPNTDELQRALEQPLRAAAETLGFSQLTIEPVRSIGEFLKLAVKGEQVLFTIDLTKISAVIRSELVSFPIPSDSKEHATVLVPSRGLQLLLKAEAFLKRPFLKTRDAFDIKLLCDSGASLDENLKAHLADGPVADRLEDPDFITERIRGVNSKNCRPELEPYLPQEVYDELEKADFESLRQALRELFADWL